jgi:hypothetical protein
MSFEQYFFTKPSFMRGFARAIDLPGVLSREAVTLSPSPAEADRRAIRSDWQSVGAALREAADALAMNGA